jgi:hypothetical protein
MPRQGLAKRLGSTRVTVYNILHEHDPAHEIDADIVCRDGEVVDADWHVPWHFER